MGRRGQGWAEQPGLSLLAWPWQGQAEAGLSLAHPDHGGSMRLPDCGLKQVPEACMGLETWAQQPKLASSQVHEVMPCPCPRGLPHSPHHSLYLILGDPILVASCQVWSTVFEGGRLGVEGQTLGALPPTPFSDHQLGLRWGQPWEPHVLLATSMMLTPVSLPLRHQHCDCMAAVPAQVALACEDPCGPLHDGWGAAGGHGQLRAAQPPVHLPHLPACVSASLPHLFLALGQPIGHQCMWKGQVTGREGSRSSCRKHEMRVGWSEAKEQEHRTRKHSIL